MKTKMTIGEYAELRKVTAETLRHYDRIGLFSPMERDPETGYRYYSILQDEKLGTIRELKELGMSIEEIKGYFDHRNLEQSFQLLKKAQTQLKARIQGLQNLEQTLGQRMRHLEVVMSHTDFESISIREIQKRLFIHKNEFINNRQEFLYTTLELEKALHESTPLLASNRIGSMVDIDENKPKRGRPFIMLEENHKADPAYVHQLPAGKYACKFYKGSLWEILKDIKLMKSWIKSQGYATMGPVYQIFQLDVSVTNQIETEVIEIQIPISSK